MSKAAELYIFLGPGGVGKTTGSAAVAAAFAARGKRAVVMTVDPAKRLAQALGLDHLSNTPTAIPTSNPKGELSALWLAADGALETLARKHAPNDDALQQMLSHRFFHIIESQLGGIEEYLGIEKALELLNSGNYDVCILDTPPSQHAIDFFESPQDLLRFFDDGVLKYFLPNKEETGPWYKKVLNIGKNRALELFQSLLGKSFFGELASLLKIVEPLHIALKQTAQQAQIVLTQESTHYMLMGSLEKYPLEELEKLNHELSIRSLSSNRSWIANKCYPQLELEHEDLLKKALGPQRFEWIRHKQLQQAECLSSVDKQQTELPQSFAKIDRHSVKHLDLKQLEEMGERILSQCKI